MAVAQELVHLAGNRLLAETCRHRRPHSAVADLVAHAPQFELVHWQRPDVGPQIAACRHRPRAERYGRGRTSPEGFYRDSFDYATFRRVLIDPFRDGAQTAATTGFQLAAFDVVRDAPVESQWVTAPRDAVLIVDGIFLHRPELRDLWDWSVWLEVPAEVAFARMALRDGSDPDPAAPSNARYRDGQDLYFREAEPLAAASVVVDNSDLAHPRRIGEGAR